MKQKTFELLEKQMDNKYLKIAFHLGGLFFTGDLIYKIFIENINFSFDYSGNILFISIYLLFVFFENNKKLWILFFTMTTVSFFIFLFLNLENKLMWRVADNSLSFIVVIWISWDKIKENTFIFSKK